MPQCKSCAIAIMMNLWCDRCDVGYVAGVRIPSKKLFEVIDPGGHEADLSRVTCEVCKAAIAGGGYCDACRLGWVDQRPYVSRLSYSLALGQPRDLRALRCADCLRNAARFGWCPTCERGMVGNVSFKSRDHVEAASAAYELLLASLAELPRCEQCALCIQTDFECHLCRIAWHNGKPAKVSQASTESKPAAIKP